jgi:hypothetical protein
MKALFIMRTFRVLAALCLIGILAGAAPALCAQGYTGERARAIVEKKGLHLVQLSVHGFSALKESRLIVPASASIYDVDGTMISYEALKVPCQAFVEYRRYPNKKPELFKIEVRSYNPKADNKFSYFETKEIDTLPR